MIEVRRISFAMASKCLTVRYASSLKIFLNGTVSVMTMATPEKMAPATK